MVCERYKSNMIYLLISIVLILGNMFLSALGVNQNFMEISYQFLFILIPSVIYIWVSKKSFVKTLRLKKVNLQQIFICVLIILVLQPLIALVATIMGSLLGQEFMALQEGMGASGESKNIFLSLFMIALTPAICEEVLMRGVVLDGYRKIPIWKVALMNGVLFGLFHNNFMQLSYTTVVGIVLTFVVIITDSIFPAVIMHFIMNGLSVLMEYYPNSIYSGFSNWYESNIIILGIVSTGSLILTVFLIKWLKKASNYKECEKNFNGICNNLSCEEESEKVSSDKWKHSIVFPEWPLLLAVAISIIYSISY